MSGGWPKYLDTYSVPHLGERSEFAEEEKILRDIHRVYSKIHTLWNEMPRPHL